MAVLPATGSEISIGRIKQAYTGVAPAAGQNISLSGTLGAYRGRAAGIETKLSIILGGQFTPYAY